MTRIVTLTSGSGGVGTGALGIGLARQLARRGQRVCLIDAGGGPDGVDAQLRLQACHTLEDLVQEHAQLRQVVIRDGHGFDILPGGRRDDWLAALQPGQLRHLAERLAQLDDYDFVFIHAPVSVARQVLALSRAATELLLVVTPASSTLTDAYALLRTLYSEPLATRVSVVINKSKNHTVARHTYNKFKEVAGFYLGLQPDLLGFVRDAGSPAAAPSDDFTALADTLLERAATAAADAVGNYWQRYCDAVTGSSGATHGSTRPQTGAAHQSLDRQLDLLSGRVDALIAQMERMRSTDSSCDTLVTLATAGQSAAPAAIDSDWLQSLASGTEMAGEGNDRFALYHRTTADGGTGYFALHGPDDALESSEHRTTSN